VLFGAFFFVTQVLEFVITFEALRLRSVLQLIVILCVLHPALIALAAVHVSQMKGIFLFSGLLPGQCYRLFGFDACEGYDSLWRQVEPYLIAVPSILFVAWVSMLFWAILLFSEFRSDSLKASDSKFVTEATSRTYQVAVCMLKISFFCFIGVLSQVLIANVPSDTIDFGLAIAMAPIVFIIFLVLIFALTRPWTRIWLIALSRLLMLGGMGYLAYMVTRVFTNSDVWYLLIIQTNLTFFTAILLFALLAGFSMSVRPLVMNLIRKLVRFITRAPSSDESMGENTET